MCGIAGIICKKNNAFEIKSVIESMVRSMKHRGPDDSGIFIQNNVAMGMTRLSIIDLYSGHQPIISEDGRYVIVYNGELYNFKDIKQQLEKEGIRFLTNSDTEVILKAYMSYGQECLTLFNGMFAFAVFDKKTSEIFVARDRLGVKPLYYSFLSGKGFAFSSELKALRLIPSFNKEIDKKALNQFFTFEYIPEPLSIFNDAKKLPVGHFLVFKNDEIKIQAYWTLDPKVDERYDFHKTKEELGALIKSSVAYRLVSDVPVGLFLSGGIDSSVIASEMRNIFENEKFASFSVCFDEKSYDESLYAKQVSAHVGSEHFSETLTAKKMLDILPEIIGKLDEPLADASVIPTYLLSRFASQKLKVVLSGDGGDEFFLGYDTHRAHKIARLFQWMPKNLLDSLLSAFNLLPVSDKNLSFEFKAKKFFSSLKYPHDIRNILWWGAYSNENLKDLFAGNVCSDEEIFEPVLKHREVLKGVDLLKQISFLDAQIYLKDDLLPKVDRMSMANSLEVRNPFLDYRLAQFSFQIPSKWKFKGNQGKYILRDLYKNQLPSGITERKKKGFDIPLTLWLRKDLNDLMVSLLNEKIIEQQGLFNFSFIQRIIEEHRSRKKNHRQLLWPLLIFQMWYKNYYNNGGA